MSDKRDDKDEGESRYQRIKAEADEQRRNTPPEVLELHKLLEDSLAKQQVLANHIQTPNGIFEFSDADYIETARGAPVEELQDALRDLVLCTDPADPDPTRCEEARKRAMEVLAMKPGWRAKEPRKKVPTDPSAGSVLEAIGEAGEHPLLVEIMQQLKDEAKAKKRGE